MEHIAFDKVRRRVEGEPEPDYIFFIKDMFVWVLLHSEDVVHYAQKAGVPCHGCGGPSMDIYENQVMMFTTVL